MNKEQALKIYNDTNKKLKVFGLMNFLSSWDAETEAPDGAILYRGETLGDMSEMYYELANGTEYKTAIDVLYENANELDDVLKNEIEKAKKDSDKLAKIPVEEYVEHQKLMNEAYPMYVKAKNTDDYEAFKPYLEKIVEFSRKYVKWQDSEDLHGYDILLDEYEDEMSESEYDRFFGLLKEKLVPFIQKVCEKEDKLNEKLTKGHFSNEKQKEFCEYLRNVMCFDKDYTVIKESEHPFTSGFGNKDVRITNHYYEDNISSSIFSAIHEMGHGLYELQVSDEIDKTMSGGGASMAMHESQSRFMENMVGRSEAFWKVHYNKLKEIFGKELDGVTLSDFVKYVNHVEKSLIRTEADELTYPMHIIVRYEIEKELIAGKVTVEELPSVWNEKYKEYLGVDVPCDKEGVLQDVHWAGGSFGYFPTYALGSAYAAQIYHAMNKDIDIEKSLEKRDISEMAKWLKDHLHKYGASKKPKELLKLATGEDFDPNYYVDYLIDKYSRLYGIE